MMHFKQNREGFSMLVALAVIITMASLSALVLNVSNKFTTETTVQYQHEQAALLARSYTEFAIMAVQANGDRSVTGKCIENINGTFGSDPDNGNGYDIQVRISYIAQTGLVSGCSSTRQLVASGQTIQTPSTQLNILVDTYVRYKMLDDTFNSKDRWHIYHRRTLQRL